MVMAITMLKLHNKQTRKKSFRFGGIKKNLIPYFEHEFKIQICFFFTFYSVNSFQNVYKRVHCFKNKCGFCMHCLWCFNVAILKNRITIFCTITALSVGSLFSKYTILCLDSHEMGASLVWPHIWCCTLRKYLFTVQANLLHPA